MPEMTHYEIEGLWLEKHLDVAFAFHDPVRIRTGERSGETGWIVALVKLEPIPTYVIEFPDGSSVNAVESAIQHTTKTL